MKKTNKFLASVLAASMICLAFAACSSEGENEESTPESDMPPISIDLSESAQTTPEITTAENTDPPETTPENTSETVSEITGSAETSDITEENTSERSETSIIEETTSGTVSVSEPQPDVSGSGEGIVRLASAMEGKPFYFGGADPDTGFDNSGLMYYVLKENGIDCPRLTNEIAEWGEKVAFEELKPGYLVFFEYEGSGKADFGGIYIGGGMMMVSTDEDRPVSVTDITTEYYQKIFQFGIKTF
jgi:cell wall-associated NlpC family hydrolase